MQTLFTQYKHKTEGLKHLAEQIAEREQLLIRLRACLTASTQSALLSAEVIEDTLILITTSATWATRLRFEAQKLLAAANNPSLRQYRIQILATHNETSIQIKQHTAVKPNTEAITSLQSIADKLAPNDSLKASMARLLALINQKNNSV